MVNIPITVEQQDVIDDVRKNHHVCVTAMPGSGKSRVAYELIRQCPEDVSVVLIMYNRSLCDATKNHLAQMGIDPGRRIQAFTFHGLASSISGKSCHTDRDIATAIDDRTPERQALWHMHDFTLLIIDEVQDMRPEFMRLVHFLFQKVSTQRDRVRAVVLGDPKQMLYDFYNHNRADQRFLTKSPELLGNLNAFKWRARRLTQSFRSTQQVATLLNVLVPEHHMVPSARDGPPVELILCNYRDPTAVVGHLLKIINAHEPGDIMVLCDSLNQRSPARHLVQSLVRSGIPVHVQRSGGLRALVPVPPSSMSGRVCFKTFHASKGLESKVVIMLHAGLFDTLSNSAYVGLSRSVEHLVVIHDIDTSSHEEVDSLKAKLRPGALTVSVQGIMSSAKCDRRLPKTRTQSVVDVDGLFTYIEPSLLGGLQKMLQSTTLDDDLFGDTDVYERLFDVRTGQNDMTTNVASILVTAVVLTMQYYRMHTLPKCVTHLKESLDPLVVQLHTRGTEILGMTLPHDADPWSLPNMCLKLQAFAMFAVALDAQTTFGEKIRELTSYAFIMSHAVVRRMTHAFQTSLKYIPDRHIPFNRRRTLRIRNTKTTLVSTPHLKSTSCTYTIVHKPEIGDDDVLSIGASLVVHRLEYGYLVNLYSGSVVQIYLPLMNHPSFMQETMRVRELREQDVDDVTFVRRYSIGL